MTTPPTPAMPEGAAPPLLLLVDDLAEIGLIVKRLARRDGLRVVHCLRAEEAWEELGRCRPNLVLLDVNLPGMSGLDLCRRLRADPRLAGLPVAVLTSGTQPEEVEAALAVGADFVVPKDLLARPDAWQTRIQEILRQCKPQTP